MCYKISLYSCLFATIQDSNLTCLHLLLCYSMLPRSTHETFAQKLYQTFKNHKRFAKPKLSRSDFTICHYAGDVSMNWFCVFFVNIVHRTKPLTKLSLYIYIFLYRSLIKQSYFWTRIKIMLLLNIRLSWMLQNVHLFRAFSLFYLRIPLNLPSFHPLVLGSRWKMASSQCFKGISLEIKS